MTKRKQAAPAPPEVLQPVSVESTELLQAKEIEVPPGHVYIIALNTDGTEQEGSGFFYPERSYKRIYGNEERYLVKKKSTLTIYNQHHYETLHRTSQQIIVSTNRRCNSCGG